MRVGLVCTDNRDDHLCLVAVAIWEGWAQWSVGESASKNCCLAWTAFTTEERAWDFSCCVSTLFNVHGEWEEVDAVTHALCGVCCGKNGGLTNLGDNRTLRLQGKFAGFEGECFVGA
ncbi:unannotated protein [freshwater metagenome]|uniref:Unannotated protein n=1 Tax=freshwater metagenome TaxID=449393 RepID=A0A6J6R2N9_9ZZZZ